MWECQELWAILIMQSTAILSICQYWFWTYFNIFSVVELSIWVLELLLVHPYRVNVAGMRFSNLSTQGGLPRCCRIWRGWVVEPILHQTLKFWNCWHFICWDCQILIFIAWSISTKAGYTKTGKEIRKPVLKDSLLPNVLAIGGKNHIHICLSLQANSWECPDPSPEIHYKTLCLDQSK
jgi:hypothetical protein